MSYAAWRVSVVLSAVNLTGAAFNNLLSSANTSQSSVARLNSALSKIGQTAMIASGVAGTALLALSAKGIQAASDLEAAFFRVQVAAQASPEQMVKLRASILKTSGMTAQSADITAQQYAALGKVFSPSQVLQLAPIFAKAADVAQRAFNADPVQTVTDMSKLAHLYGKYGVNDVQNLVDGLYGILKVSPDNMAKTVTQSKYFVPMATSLGMRPQDLLDITAGMAIQGFLSGRGGTGVANAIFGGLQATVLNNHLSAAKARADSRLGLITPDGRSRFFNYQTRSFDYVGMMRHLAQEQDAYAKAKDGRIFSNDIEAAFGRGATQLIIASLRKETVAQLALIDAKLKATSIDRDFNDSLKLFSTQAQILQTNLHNLLAITFYPLMQAVTPYMASFASYLSGLVQSLATNPGAALKLAIGIFVAGVGLIGVPIAAATIGVMNFAKNVAILAATLQVANAATITGSVGGAAGGLGKFAGIVGRVGNWLSGASFFSLIGGWLKPVGAAIASHPILRTILGVHSPVFGASRAGLFGINWAQRGLFGGIGQLTMTKMPWIKDAIEAIIGVNSTRFGMSRAGLFGINWAQRGLSAGVGTLLGRVPYAAEIGRVLAFIPKFGLGIAELGIKFVPVIGWALTLIQVFQLLKDHGTDISWVLGKVVGFMRYHLWPGIVSAFEAGWPIVVSAAQTKLSQLWNLIATLLTHPQSLITGGAAWWNAQVGAFMSGQASEGPQPTPMSPVWRKRGLPDELRPIVQQDNKIIINGANDPNVHKKVVQELNRRAAFGMRTGVGTMSTSTIPELQMSPG